MDAIKKYNTGFTQIPNKMLCDPRLSERAKGIYAYLFSKPDGWQFHANVIQKEISCSIRVFRKIVNELVNLGYIQKKQFLDASRRFGGMIYEFLNPEAQEKPIKPLTKKPSDAFGRDGVLGETVKNVTHNNTNLQSNTELYATNTENTYNSSARVCENSVNCNDRKTFVDALPLDIFTAIKEQIIPKWDSYSCGRIAKNGSVIQAPNDEQIKKYVQNRVTGGWVTKTGRPIYSIGTDIVDWMSRDVVAPDVDIIDAQRFVDVWNRCVYNQIKSVSKDAKVNQADIESVKNAIPAAKNAILSVIKETRQLIDNGKLPFWPVKSQYWTDPWLFAVAMFLERRFYSNFLYSGCLITPKFFFNNIQGLISPFSDLYLDDTSIHTKNITLVS